jgi:hypothetical protein
MLSSNCTRSDSTRNRGVEPLGQSFHLPLIQCLDLYLEGTRLNPRGG